MQNILNLRHILIKLTLNAFFLLRSSLKTLKNNGIFSAVALIFLLLTFSCSDNTGCIDAEDYGEYEIDNIEVSPKILAASCDVDSSVKDTSGNIDYFSIDAKHGKDFLTCITSKQIKFSYFDEGIEKTESSTCLAVKANVAKFSACISRCKILCPIMFSNSFEKTALSYTYNNIRSGSTGINIYPNSQINIDVSGTATLTSDKSFPTALITPEQVAPKYLDLNGQNQVVNINSGKSIIPYFTGISSAARLETNSTQTLLPKDIAKFGSRIGVLTSPFPFNHSFSANSNSELIGSYGLPILPDPRAWLCTYGETSQLCKNSYSSAGYKNISDTLADQYMPPNILDLSGVRNNVAKLTQCNELCRTYELGPGAQIAITPGIFPLEENLAYNVLMKLFSSSYSCDSILIDLQTTSSNESFTDFPKVKNLSTSFNNIDNAFMAKNKNTKLIIKNLSTSTNSCKFFINLAPTYFDYKVPYSGFLSMGYAKGTNSLPTEKFCNIYGRITNPNALNSQYFEYKESQDPLNYSLQVDESSWNKNGIFVRKGQVVRLDVKSFVEPDLQSLNIRTMNTKGLSEIDCMMGLGIDIEPMPALLCLEDKSTSIKLTNTKCTTIYKNEMPIGCTPQIDDFDACKNCKAKEYKITTAKDANNKPISVNLTYKCNFTIDNDSCESSGCGANKIYSFGEKCFRKCCKIKSDCIGTGCYSGQFMEYKSVEPVFTPITTDNITTITASCPPEIPKHSCETDSECQECKKELQSIEISAYNDITIESPCYDFENYTGSMSAFYSKYDTDLKNKDPRDTTVTGFFGAKLLEKFDSSLNYGSISSYQDYGTASNTAVAGDLDSETMRYLYFSGSAIKPNQNSRLKFFQIKDGSSFLDYKPTYNSNDNKFIKIKVKTAANELKSGEMLEALLCKQAEEVCTPITNNSKIISDYGSGSSFSVNNVSGDYKYSNGKLLRYTGTAGNLDCIPSSSNKNNNANSPFIDADFFCHNSDVKTYNQLQSYKLGFRFQDPDIANCYVSTNGSDMCDAVVDKAKNDTNASASTKAFFSDTVGAHSLNNYLQQYKRCDNLAGYGEVCPSRSCLDENCKDNVASSCKKSIELSDDTYKVSVLKNLLDYYQDYKNGDSKIFYGERMDAMAFVKEACRRYYDPLNTRLTNPAGTYYCRTTTDALGPDSKPINFVYTENCCEQSSFYNNFCDIKQAEEKIGQNGTFRTNEFTTPIAGCTNKDLAIIKLNNNCYISSSCLGSVVKTALPATEEALIISECKSKVIKSCKSQYGYYDGIKTTNPSYNSNSSSNRNGMCSLEEMINGCEKEFYCINKYQENTGSYKVRIKTKKLISDSITDKDSETEYQNKLYSGSVIVGSFLGVVINSLVDVLDGKVRRDDSGNILYLDKNGDTSTTHTGTVAKEAGLLQENYKKIILNKTFQGLVKTCLLLFVAIYGLFYVMGLATASHHEILLKVAKIGFIYLFIGSSGWYWFDKFFVTLFKEGIDYLSLLMTSSFDNSATIANAIKAGDYYNKSIMFSAPDQVLNMFFSNVVHKKIWALLFENLFGWAYVALLYYSVFMFILAIFSSLLLYVVAQIFISILLMLGPIFIAFLVFDRTKQFFDNWIKELIGFSFQQIFLMLVIGFFSVLFYELFRMSLNFGICYESLWTITLFGSSLDILKSWSVEGSHAVLSIIPQTNYVSNDSNPSIFSVLMVVVVAMLAKEFIGIATAVGKSIAGSSMSIKEISNNMQQSIEAVGSAASGMMKQGLGKIDEKLGITSRLDDKLFDSGKIADERRTENKGKIDTQKELTRGVEKDVEKYKKELSGLTPDERSKELGAVKESSLASRGKEMGLSNEDMKDLKSFRSNSQDVKDYLGNVSKALVSNKNKENGLSYKENLKSALKDTSSLEGMANDLQGIKEEDKSSEDKKSSFEKNLDKIN